MTELTTEKITKIMNQFNDDDIKKLTPEEKYKLINSINDNTSLSETEKFIHCGIILYNGKKEFIAESQKIFNKYENDNKNKQSD